MVEEELRDLFLRSADRQYFLITRTVDEKPLGRFYYRAWRFGGEIDGIDWGLNILLADLGERGKGYGTATQRLAADYLLARPDTRSVFAYTTVGNTAERRALVLVMHAIILRWVLLAHHLGRTQVFNRFDVHCQRSLW